MQLILVINRRTRIEYYVNKFSTLIPIKLLGLIVHGLSLLGVNVFAIECIYLESDWIAKVIKKRKSFVKVCHWSVNASTTRWQKKSVIYSDWWVDSRSLLVTNILRTQAVQTRKKKKQQQQQKFRTVETTETNNQSTIYFHSVTYVLKHFKRQ